MLIRTATSLRQGLTIDELETTFHEHLTHLEIHVTSWVTPILAHGLPVGERMELYISNGKLRRAFEDEDLSRRYGLDMAKRIRLRLAALQAAENLGAFWPPDSGPERCHELEGDRAGTFAFDLRYPQRLLVRPIEETPPEDRSDEQQLWNSITSLEIIGIEDIYEQR